MSQINNGFTVSGNPDQRTFSVARVADSNVQLRDTSGGVLIGFPTLSIKWREPNKTSKVWRADIELRVPKLEVAVGANQSGLTPAPTLAYYCTAKVSFECHERSTAAERADLLQLMTSVMGVSQVHDLVVSYDPIV